MSIIAKNNHFLFKYLATRQQIVNINPCLLTLQNAHELSSSEPGCSRDMMVALFIAPRFIIILSHFFMHPDGMTGTLFCKLLTGGNLTWTGGAASVFTLVAIAFERYYAVMYPYCNKGKLTYNKLKVWISKKWICCMIIVIVIEGCTKNVSDRQWSKEHGIVLSFMIRA